MIEIVNENIHRVVTEEAFNAYWKNEGFERVAVLPDITALRAEADALGITYHPNIGAEKLLEKIDEFKAKK